MLHSFGWPFINTESSFHSQKPVFSPPIPTGHQGWGGFATQEQEKKSFTPTEKLNQISGSFVSP